MSRLAVGPLGWAILMCDLCDQALCISRRDRVFATWANADAAARLTVASRPNSRSHHRFARSTHELHQTRPGKARLGRAPRGQATGEAELQLRRRPDRNQRALQLPRRRRQRRGSPGRHGEARPERGRIALPAGRDLPRSPHACRAAAATRPTSSEPRAAPRSNSCASGVCRHRWTASRPSARSMRTPGSTSTSSSSTASRT